MQLFRSALKKASRVSDAATLATPASPASPSGRRWIYVPYDQLTDEVGPLAQLLSPGSARASPSQVGIILIESDEWLRRRPYHRQKIATILLNQRAFAIEQASRGVRVVYESVRESIGERLATLSASLGPITMMEAAERELRVELAPLVADGRLRVEPNAMWLTTSEHFRAACGEGDRPHYRMDRFYREVRNALGVLMEDGKPIGGRYSFDGENRERWNGTPEAPRPIRFRRGPLRDELESEILTRFTGHPGKLDMGAIPGTRSEVQRLWRWALAECLPNFGPFEDAMSVRSRGLFHTRITPVLNIGRLLPQRVLADVLAAAIPLPSQEGFVRQLLGWREFVRHVHRATDGFRIGNATAARPGDGGFERWSGKSWTSEPGGATPSAIDGGATPNALEATMPLPPAWWGRQSGMACLDSVVADVWSEGWSHHITRLMVLSNIATLLGVSPRELTDWFWVAYADAYDWVVEPNVLGMGTFAIADRMTTKPYVSGAAYIHSMGDYCAACVFDPRKDCPITSLYWEFLRRNDERLSENERMRMPLAASRKRSPEQRDRDRRVVVHVQEVLIRGERLTPQGIRQLQGNAPPNEVASEGSPSDRSGEPEAVGTDSLFP